MADASGKLRLLAVLAHPDDESLGNGGALARYAAEGVETYLVTATRGERGRYFDPDRERPSDEEVGRVREAELRAAARELGVREVVFLDYVDGSLDRADPREAIARITAHIRRIRPQVVVTFDSFGAYGHPDHVAICQYATAACALAPDASHEDGHAPHHVSKLYYKSETPDVWEAYQKAFKRLGSTVDGVERSAIAWPEWSTSALLDTRAHASTVWRAIQRHRTQIAIYAGLSDLSDADHERLWGRQHYYRVYSTVNGGRARETDLFEGLR
ncbi:MAG TPA: PIG-L family deacetylase [Longimicrobiales bacterium]|nr:PIG-L family deacetylase [Longimicrobiales bacterium]